MSAPAYSELRRIGLYAWLLGTAVTLGPAAITPCANVVVESTMCEVVVGPRVG